MPDPDGSVTTDYRPGSGDTDTFITDQRFQDIVIEEAQVTLQGDITVISDDHFEIDDGSRVFIDGNVTLVSFEDFQQEKSPS